MNYFLILFLCIIFVGIIIYLIQNTWNYFSPSTIETRYRFDHWKAATNTNYNICKKLSHLQFEVDNQLQDRLEVNKIYTALRERNELYCGTIRGGWGIFTKKKVVPNNCIPEILDAKKELLMYLEDICTIQYHANKRFQHLLSSYIVHNTSHTNSVLLSKKHSTLVQQTTNQLHETTSLNHDSIDAAVHETTISSSSSNALSHTNQYRLSLQTKRGILYTGAKRHLIQIYQSIYALYMYNNTLPIEIWMNEADQYFCQYIVNRLLSRINDRFDVTCQILSHSQNGFVAKFDALSHTSFSDVIFLDCDNIAVQNIEILFDTAEYTRYGIILWPDYNGEKCRVLATQHNSAHGSHLDSGCTGWRTHVFYSAHFANLQYHYDYLYTHEAEAGQVVINLRRHAGLMKLGQQLLEHPFFRKQVYGDKDIFRFIFLFLNEEYYMVRHYPGYSFLPNGNRDSIVHYFYPISTSTSNFSPVTNTQKDLLITSPSKQALADSTTKKSDYIPYFFHQLKQRHSDAFGQVLTIADKDQDDISACFSYQVRYQKEYLDSSSSSSSASSSTSSASSLSLSDTTVTQQIQHLRTHTRYYWRQLQITLSTLIKNRSHLRTNQYEETKLATTTITTTSITDTTHSSVDHVNTRQLNKHSTTTTNTSPDTQTSNNKVPSENWYTYNTVHTEEIPHRGKLIRIISHVYTTVDDDWKYIKRELYFQDFLYGLGIPMRWVYRIGS